jgi:two-component system, NarL family, nitrate/nitrite response regulator NarL
MARTVTHRNPRIRVLLVGTDTMGSHLLAGALKRGRTGLDVITLVGNSQDIVRSWVDHKPEVAVVSAELQDGVLKGFHVLQKLRESHPYTPVIMLFHSRNRDFVVNAFRSGARGIFYRNQTSKTLSKCIRMVHRGQIWASNEDLEHVFDTLTQFKPLQFAKIDGKARLTRREEDVVRLVSEGMMNAEIARTLRLTEHSVRNYLSAIFKKLGVASRVELVLYVFAKRQEK